MADPKYSEFRLNLQSDFEQRALLLVSIAHLPVAFIFPYAYATLLYSAISYFVIHNLAHRFPRIGRKFFPWHYAHHLGVDQHKNWGVRLPIFDYIFGTRVKYVGTEKEADDIFKYVLKQSQLRDERAAGSCSNSSKRY